MHQHIRLHHARGEKRRLLMGSGGGWAWAPERGSDGTCGKEKCVISADLLEEDEPIIEHLRLRGSVERHGHRIR